MSKASPLPFIALMLVGIREAVENSVTPADLVGSGKRSTPTVNAAAAFHHFNAFEAGTTNIDDVRDIQDLVAVRKTRGYAAGVELVAALRDLYEAREDGTPEWFLDAEAFGQAILTGYTGDFSTAAAIVDAGTDLTGSVGDALASFLGS